MKRLLLLFTAFLCSAPLFSQNKMALIEMTTSVNCHNCPGANDYIDSLALQFPGKLLVLRYQAPLYGIDPLFIQDSAEINARMRFMLGPHPNIGLPGTYLNGDSNFISPRFVTPGMIDSINSKRSHFAVSISHQYTSDYDSISVSVNVASDTVQSFSPGGLRLTLIMMEDSIHMDSPPGNNGEKDFYFECRKFLTQVSGDTLPNQWSAGQSWTRTFSLAIPAYIYDLNNLYVLGIVQNLSNRDMLQSAASTQFKAPHYAGIDRHNSLIFPSITCNSTLSGVKAYVRNMGMMPLQTCDLMYWQNQDTPDTLHWSGFLLTDSTARIDLPAFNLGTDGKHVIQVKVIRPNGTHIADSRANSFSNSIESNQLADSPPVNAYFTDPHFPYHGWCVLNPSRDGNTWQRVAVETTPGNYILPSLLLRCFGMAEGTVNEFYLPETDVSHLASMALSFNVSHRGGQIDDTLKVLLTTDCGKTWHTVYSRYSAQISFNSGGQFEYKNPPDSTDETQWKMQYADLSSFAGNQKIQLRFQYTHEQANNIFIRKIYFGPHASLVDQGEESLRLFPNPAAEAGVSLELPESVSLLGVDVYTPDGSRVMEQNYSGVLHRTVIHTSGWPSGLYLIHVKTDRGVMVRKLVMM